MTCYTHNGERLSITGWSRKLGIKMSNLVSRLKRGIPFEMAISRSRLPSIDKSPVVSYNGETHSLREWAKRLNLKYRLLYSRFRSGQPVERVLSTVRLRPHGNLQFRWQPRIFVEKAGERLTVPEWSRRIGVPANTIYQRIIRRDGDVSESDEILSQRLPPGGKGKHKCGTVYEVKGISLTVPQWAKRLHCTTTILYRRLEKGLEPEDVFVKPKRDGRNPILYTKDGITLPLTGWAKKLGLSIHALRARLLRSKDLDYVLAPRKPGGFVTMWRGRKKNLGNTRKRPERKS